MSARPDIENTLNLWSFGFDENRPEIFEQVFAKEVFFTMRIADGDLIGPWEGRDAVVKLMLDSLSTTTDKRRHLRTNTVFHSEDAETATVESFLVITGIVDGAAKVVSTGRYEDELRLEDGAWRIAKRHVALDLPY